MSASDKALVLKFLKSKNEKYFTLLYKKYADTTYRLALFLTGHDPLLTDDLVQETWIVIVEQLSTFRWKSSLKTWISGILINKFRQNLRKNRPYSELAPEMRVTSPYDSEIMDLQQAILSLPMGYREVIVMHDLEGFKHREIAEILNIKEGTSKSQLFMARQQMRKFLTDYSRKDM